MISRRTAVSAMALGVAAVPLLLLPAVPIKADTVRALKWAELVPPREPSPLKPKTFYSGSAPAGDETPPPMREGKFMSMKRRQPGNDLPPRVVTELDSKRVSIGGYVVPLDFEATRVTDFLLVPFVGACIHVPPPPANQIIYVKFPGGIEIKGAFDPISVTGTIHTVTAFTGLADAGYSLDAETVTVIEQ
ncbi:MAG: DUF3299 domain-containing protein [Hyphomicrobiaceae bacterium]